MLAQTILDIWWMLLEVRIRNRLLRQHFWRLCWSVKMNDSDFIRITWCLLSCSSLVLSSSSLRARPARELLSSSCLRRSSSSARCLKQKNTEELLKRVHLFIPPFEPTLHNRKCLYGPASLDQNANCLICFFYYHLSNVAKLLFEMIIPSCLNYCNSLFTVLARLW